MRRMFLPVLMVSAIIAVSCGSAITPSTLTPSVPVSPTRTPTSAPAHTAISTATPTSILTSAATPTPIPQPEAIVATEALNVRSGPGVNYDKLRQVKEGEKLKIIGRTEASDWLKIVTSDGQEGWVAAKFVTVNTNLGRVVVAQAPPTPTPVPATPTPTLPLEARPEPGYWAPDFTLSDLYGNQVSLSNFRGKVVVLNIWTTWCKPCVEEMPNFQSFHQDYANAGITVIAINRKEEPGTVSNLVQQYGLTFTVLLDTSGQVSNTYQPDQKKTLPTTFFIDKAGIIREKRIGGPIGKQELIDKSCDLCN